MILMHSSVVPAAEFISTFDPRGTQRDIYGSPRIVIERDDLCPGSRFRWGKLQVASLELKNRAQHCP